MLSQTAEYALRAIVFLADNAGQAHTTEAIALVTRVPLGYLAKIMQALAKAGLVVSQRGLHGGFTLHHKPDDLSIYDIVQVIDPINRITTCPLGLEGHGPNLCPLHRRLDNAMAAIEMAFRKTTIAQLLADPNTTRPLCPFPHKPADVAAAAQAPAKAKNPTKAPVKTATKK